MEKVLSQTEIEREIKEAEIDDRPANFKGKTLSALLFCGKRN